MPNDPVQKTFVNVGLTGGVNKKRDAHQLRNGELLSANNVIFTNIDGQICKRNGFAPVTPQGAPFQGGPFKAIGCRDNVEPIILGQNTLNRYNSAQNLSTSIPTPTQVRVDTQNVAGSSSKNAAAYPPFNAQIASDGSSYIAVIYEEPNNGTSNVFYGIQDLTTQNWIIPPTLIPGNVSMTLGGNNYSGSQIWFPQVNYYNGYYFFSMLWQGSYNNSGTQNYAQSIITYTLPLTNLAGGLTLNAYHSELFTGATYNTAGNVASLSMHIANGRFMHCAENRSTSSDTTLKMGMGTISGTTFSQQYFLTPGLPNGAPAYSSSGTRVCCKCDGPSAVPWAAVIHSYVYTVTAAGGLVTQTGILNNVNATYFQYEPVALIWSTWNGSPQLVIATYTTAPSMPSYGNTNNRINAVSVTSWVIDVTNTGNRGYATGGGNYSCLVTPPVPSRLVQVLSEPFFEPTVGTLCIWIAGASCWNDAVYNGAYLMSINPSGVQPYSSVYGAMCVTRINYLTNPKSNNGDRNTPTQVIKSANGTRFIAYLSQAAEKVGSGSAYGALSRVTVDFAPARGAQIVSLPTGGNLIAGGFPLYYDGAAVVEAGFSAAPDFSPGGATTPQSTTAWSVASVTTGLAGGTSAITASGYVEYYYVCCWVRRDQYGNVYRSAPSPTMTVLCANAVNSVTFPQAYYYGGGNVAIEYYRSTQGTPGTYYFLAQVPLGQTFTDATPDGSTTPSNNTSITKNRTVYTNSNELPNDPPPPIFHCAVSESRAYIIPSDNRNVIWYSKQFSPGRTVEFCANLTLSEGLNSGQFSGLAVLDANLIVFKNDAILYTYGNGPDNTGSGSSFAPFQKIASDVGCIDPGSIAVIPNGVVFRSRRGIELLTRGLQVQYIGGPVESLVGTNGALSSVVCMPNFAELRFVPASANNTGTYNGVAGVGPTNLLTYDYMGNRWSTQSNMAAVQAVNINNDYWWISSDGTLVNKETPGQYLDNGQPIKMTIETPEIPCGAGGAQGWGRIYRMALLGDFFSAHQLQVSFAYDHQVAYTNMVTFNTTSGLISGDTVYQFRCSRLPRQVMQTLKLKIEDTGTTGQSCAISALALEVGSKNGLAKLPPVKTL